MAEPREHETRELIEHLRLRRLRRTWGRVLLVTVGAAVAVAAVITGVVLATGASGDEAPDSTLASTAGVSTTEA